MSTVKVARTVRYTVTTDDGREFETYHEPENDTLTVKPGKDGRTVIGYLVQDEGEQDIFGDEDGNGEIASHLDHNQAGRERMKAALGIDDNGDPDPDMTPDPYAVPLDCFRHGGELWQVQGSSTGYPFSCPWDTSRLAGVWIPCDCARENIEGRAKAENMDPVKVAREYAAGVIEQYNQALSGDVWGVIVEVYDKDGEKIDGEGFDCWGFFGSEYAVKELAEQVKDAAEEPTA